MKAFFEKDDFYKDIRCNKKSNIIKDVELLDDDNMPLDPEVEMALYMYQDYPCLRKDIREYVSILKNRVIGQDEALEKLMFVAYYNQYVNFIEEYTESDNYKRNNMLLIAPTGCGKSTMLRAIEKVFDVPVYRANITAMTSAGYVGDKIESMLLGLIERAKGDIKVAEKGILLIDEIDKKITSTTTDRDVAGKAVQQELLKLFDRGIVNITISGGDGNKAKRIEFNTGKLTIILAGACVGLNEVRKKRLRSKVGIGFSANNEEPETIEEYTSQDLIEYGFIPELVGRIDIIQEFKEYSQSSLIDIIYFSEESTMQAYVRILKSLNIQEILIDGLLWERIASQILESNLGVRELNNMMTKLFYPIMYEAFHHRSKGVCVIDSEGNYILKYPEEQKEYKGKCISFLE